MKRHTALAMSGICLLSLLAACSDDKKSTLFPDQEGNEITLPEGVTLPDGSGDGSDGGITVPAGNNDLGSCYVKVEGDVTAEWTSGGGYSAVGYGPWTPQAGGTIAGMAMDETFFILNCVGDGSNSLTFAPMADVGVPMQPTTFVIEPATNALGTSENTTMSILITFDGPAGQTNWGPSAAGELVITEFDADHIAGTFRIPITDVLAKLSGTSMGNAMVTGEFNYKNPN